MLKIWLFISEGDEGDAVVALFALCSFAWSVQRDIQMFVLKAAPAVKQNRSARSAARDKRLARTYAMTTLDLT